MPESFKVLIKELQSLGLDIKILNEDQKEISIKDITEDEDESFEVPTKKTKHFENGKLVLEEEIDLDAFADIKLDDEEDDELLDDEEDDESDLPEFDTNSLFEDEDEAPFEDKFADRALDDDDLSDLDELLVGDTDNKEGK